MELKNAFSIIEKQLTNKNNELGFKRSSADDKSIVFSGDKGMYRLVYNPDGPILEFDCAYETDESEAKWNTVSKTLFELEAIEERDAKSTANEISDEITSLFAARKKVDLDKIKMPKAVSRTKAKNGAINYDTDSLANRFGVLFPDLKDKIKRNIAAYGEFLPETFFMEYGTPRVLDVLRNGSDAEVKKMFKMLNEVYEDGTNEVQDIIGVTILGEMKGDKELMTRADEYMIEYMAGPVHEINKLTAKNNRLTKKLKNPPPFKPKKEKNMLQNALTGQMK